MKKFHVLSFALACGLTWGLYLGLLALVAMWWGLGSDIIDLLGTGYIGLKATPLGALIGLIWGFVDAFIGGLIFAWLYNLLTKKFK